jgi:hypothetical protein
MSYIGDFGWWPSTEAVPMLLLWGFIVLTTVALMKFVSARSPALGRVPRGIPLKSLEQRYARGEIDRS